MPGPEGKKEDGKATVLGTETLPLPMPSASPQSQTRGRRERRSPQTVRLELSTWQRRQELGPRRDIQPQHLVSRELPLALPQWPQGSSLHPRAGETLGSQPRASAHMPGWSQLRCQGCQLNTLHICRKLTHHTPYIHTDLCTFQKKDREQAYSIQREPRKGGARVCTHTNTPPVCASPTSI